MFFYFVKTYFFVLIFCKKDHIERQIKKNLLYISGVATLWCAKLRLNSIDIRNEIKFIRKL